MSHKYCTPPSSSGNTMRPPIANCCNSGSGISVGAAVTEPRQTVPHRDRAEVAVAANHARLRQKAGGAQMLLGPLVQRPQRSTEYISGKPSASNTAV